MILFLSLYGLCKAFFYFFLFDYVGVWINSIFTPICYDIHSSSYTKLATDNPHLLLATFLPVLLFESAFAMDVHTFYKMFIQVRIYLIIQKFETSICRVSIKQEVKKGNILSGLLLYNLEAVFHFFKKIILKISEKLQ